MGAKQFEQYDKLKKMFGDNNNNNNNNNQANSPQNMNPRMLNLKNYYHTLENSQRPRISLQSPLKQPHLPPSQIQYHAIPNNPAIDPKVHQKPTQFSNVPKFTTTPCPTPITTFESTCISHVQYFHDHEAEIAMLKRQFGLLSVDNFFSNYLWMKTQAQKMGQQVEGKVPKRFSQDEIETFRSTKNPVIIEVIPGISQRIIDGVTTGWSNVGAGGVNKVGKGNGAFLNNLGTNVSSINNKNNIEEIKRENDNNIFLQIVNNNNNFNSANNINNLMVWFEQYNANINNRSLDGNNTPNWDNNSPNFNPSSTLAPPILASSSFSPGQSQMLNNSDLNSQTNQTNQTNHTNSISISAPSQLLLLNDNSAGILFYILNNVLFPSVNDVKRLCIETRCFASLQTQIQVCVVLLAILRRVNEGIVEYFIETMGMVPLFNVIDGITRVRVDQGAGKRIVTGNDNYSSAGSSNPSIGSQFSVETLEENQIENFDGLGQDKITNEAIERTHNLIDSTTIINHGESSYKVVFHNASSSSAICENGNDFSNSNPVIFNQKNIDKKSETMTQKPKLESLNGNVRIQKSCIVLDYIFGGDLTLVYPKVTRLLCDYYKTKHGEEYHPPDEDV
jgi:hypothetical protein